MLVLEPGVLFPMCPSSQWVPVLWIVVCEPLQRPMGANGGLWGPMRNCADLWGLLGIYGDLWGAIGTYGKPLGAYGHLWGHMRIYRPPRGHMGASGSLWGPIGTYGDLWRSIGAYGDLLGGGDHVFAHPFQHPPAFPRAIGSIPDMSHMLLYTFQKQHAPSDIRLQTLYTLVPWPCQDFFFALILCLVPVTPCETMLCWPRPHELVATQSTMCFVDPAPYR